MKASTGILSALGDGGSTADSSIPASLPARASAYAPAGKHLDKLKKDRQNAEERRAQEVLEAREQAAQLRQKLEAATSRKKVLEETNKDLKASLSKLLQKINL